MAKTMIYAALMFTGASAASLLFGKKWEETRTYFIGMIAFALLAIAAKVVIG